MKTQLSIFFASILLFTGCVRYQRQPKETEPHAVVEIAPDSGSRYQAIVKKIDGRDVHPDRAYRVAPGSHQVIIMSREYIEEELGPFATSYYRCYVESLSPSLEHGSQGNHILGSSRLGDLRVVGWASHNITNTITVEAGWSYTLDGEQINKTRLLD